MPKYNFDRMLQSRPTEAIKILLNFIKILSQRLRETTNRMMKAKSEAESASAALPTPQPPMATPAPTSPMQVAPEKLAIRDGAQKGNELYVLTLEELQNPNLYQILEQKRQQGLITDSSSRLLMIRDLVNYYLQLPMEELQLKVREMELRFRNRPRV